MDTKGPDLTSQLKQLKIWTKDMKQWLFLGNWKTAQNCPEEENEQDKQYNCPIYNLESVHRSQRMVEKPKENRVLTEWRGWS